MRTRAVYHTAINEAYQGNPLIEALPVLTEAEVRKGLTQHPKYDPEHRKADTAARMECLEKLCQFFEALPRHWLLANDLQSMLRVGYAHRNPLAASNAERSMVSASLMGQTGLGKTASTRRILALLPKVIEHDNYQGRAWKAEQLVTLLVECPHRASALGVCRGILEKMDEALGTNHQSKLVKNHSSSTSLMPEINKLIRQHHLGLLVIDEIQNLKATEEESELFTLLVRLINDSVPVLMIGTTKTANPGEEYMGIPLSSRVRRRMTSLTNPHWASLGYRHPEWRLFLKGLWRYQYVRQDSPLTEQMEHALHDLTQGVPDLVVKTYLAAQRWAILEGGETVTLEVLLAAGRKTLAPMREHLVAQRLAAGAAKVRPGQAELPMS